MADPAELQKGLYDAVLNGNARKAEEMTRLALETGVDPVALIKECVTPAMEEVGAKFECNEYFVPELLIAMRAMKAAVGLIAPHLGSGQSAGRVVIGTVHGDLHDIGKNLVAAMLQGCGFEVVDLGVDVPAERFVEAAQQQPGTLVAMSALLTTTMTQMQRVIEALKAAGIRDQVKVMIGGAPINQEYADQIGADGYSDNASAAVGLARRLVGAPSAA